MKKLIIIQRVLITFCIILGFLMASSSAFAQQPSTTPAPALQTTTSTTSPEKASPSSQTAPSASAPASQQMKAPQQPIVGQIAWVVGTVKAVSANKDIPERLLDRRSPIYLHDTILSDQKSTCQIVFSDNSTISMRSDTVFRVDEYAFGKDVPAGKAKFVVNVVKGGFRTITGLIPKENPGNYQVKTPVATIAVQGTDYEVFHTLSSAAADRKKEALANASAVTKGRTVVARNSGTPVVTTGGKTIILNDKNKYVSVPDLGKLIPLPIKPTEFTHPVKMESAVFSPKEMNMTFRPAPPETTDKSTAAPGTEGSAPGSDGGTGTTGEGGTDAGTTGTDSGGTTTDGTTSGTDSGGTSDGTSGTDSGGTSDGTSGSDAEAGGIGGTTDGVNPEAGGTSTDTSTDTSAPSSATPSSGSPTTTTNFCVM